MDRYDYNSPEDNKKVKESEKKGFFTESDNTRYKFVLKKVEESTETSKIRESSDIIEVNGLLGSSLPYCSDFGITGIL